jgi:hypothetical protein
LARITFAPACKEKRAPMESIHQDFYKKMEPLGAEHGGTRIYSPISYAIVRDCQIVPVVHIEALALAAWFPICWRTHPKRRELVALRSLRADGSAQPSGSPENMNSLPLMLRAFPFAVLKPQEIADPDAHYFEDATADRPTDIGAAILLPDGRPGRGAQMRLRAVQAYLEARQLTDDMTNTLTSLDLFEPWPLDFKVDDEPLRVEDMLIVRQTAFGQSPIQQFLKQFGPAGALLLGAHRISLFRAGNLVQAAQQRRPPRTGATC